MRAADLRAIEYAHLSTGGGVYLDYTGAGAVSASQLRAHVERLSRTCYSNPHSDNPTSAASTALVESARRKVLAFLNADPAEYAVVFTPNATGATSPASYTRCRGSKRRMRTAIWCCSTRRRTCRPTGWT